jgi:PAS domain S-box-containing protein
MLPLLPDYRVRQRDYLLEISRALTEALDLPTVLQRILKAAAELISGQAGLIALRDAPPELPTPWAGGARWRVQAHYGIPEPFLAHFAPLLADIPEHGDPRRFAVPEVNRRLQAITQSTALGLLSGVALPLIARHDVLGIIYIFRAYPVAFTANDQALLGSFADQAAIAVYNAQLYQQVTQEKRRLDAILDSSADGILIMDPGHRIQRFNRALSRLIGWGASDAIGQTHDDVLRWARRPNGPDLAESEAGGWPLGTTPAPLYVEGDLLRKGGGYSPAGVTYAPLFDREGRLVNLIANVRDITKFREAEALKSTFVSVVSHELKTPVALIKGYAETLRREDAQWDRAMVRDSLAVINEEADRLTELIDNLLDASRLQAGALKLNMAEAQLDRLTQRLVEKFETQSDVHTWSVEFPAEFPPVPGDEERLGQVVSNLLSNAIKYSPAGGTIRVTGKMEPHQVTLSVSDQGPGISAPDLPHIFERFYRGDSELTKRAKGAGLGLYLAKSVVEAHGGRIWAESIPGAGTTFLFSLPR